MLDVLLAAGSYAAVIAVGALCAQTGFISPSAKNVISRMVFDITLPCAVAYSFVGFAFDPGLLMATATGLAVTVFGFLGSFIYSRRLPSELRSFHTINGNGYNIGCFALPFISSQFGSAGVVIACMFDAGNALMVSGGGYALTRSLVLGKKTGSVVGSIVRTMLKSPALDCYLVLVALSVVGISLPQQVGTIIAPFAQANSFLAMFMIGLAFEWRIDGRRLKEVIKLMAWRLFVSAVFCCLVYFALPMPYEIKVVTIVCMLAPIMSVGIIYTMWLDGDVKLAGFANSLSVVVALILMTAATLLLG